MKFETALKKLSASLEGTHYYLTKEENIYYIGFHGTNALMPLSEDFLRYKMENYGPSAMIAYVKDVYINRLYPDKKYILNNVHFSLRDIPSSLITMCYAAYEEFANMALFSSLDVVIDDFETTVIPVRTQYAEYLGIDHDMLREAALANTEKAFKMAPLDIFSGTIETNGMYIITNKSLLDGAASIVCADKIFEKIGRPKNRFILIPTSVHEFIAYEDDGKRTVEEAREMIADINRCFRFIKEDFLSYDTYYMDKDGSVKVLK
jgi:hypothetical protein